MNKRLISRLMHERVSDLRSSGVYFFRGDFEYILRGVVIEYVPRGAYIWNFRFPLFDFFGPNLNYSDRFPGSAFIGKEEMSDAAIVDYIVASPEGQDAFRLAAPTSLSDFVQYLLTSDALLSPHARLIHAAALVLLDQEARAADLLEEILPDMHSSDIPHWRQLREDLRRGPDIARSLLDRVRQENLRTLGVT
jgi:hypothetical protein